MRSRRAPVRTSSNPRKLSERLDETLRRYHNRAVDSLQVIEELIALAKDIVPQTRAGASSGSTPGASLL